MPKILEESPLRFCFLGPITVQISISCRGMEPPERDALLYWCYFLPEEESNQRSLFPNRNPLSTENSVQGSHAISSPCSKAVSDEIAILCCLAIPHRRRFGNALIWFNPTTRYVILSVGKNLISPVVQIALSPRPMPGLLATTLSCPSGAFRNRRRCGREESIEGFGFGKASCRQCPETASKRVGD